MFLFLGYGSNLNTLIKNSRDNSFPIKIRLVVCNNKNANGIKYAKKNSIPYLIINTKKNNYEFTILKSSKNIKYPLFV